MQTLLGVGRDCTQAVGTTGDFLPTQLAHDSCNLAPLLLLCLFSLISHHTTGKLNLKQMQTHLLQVVLHRVIIRSWRQLSLFVNTKALLFLLAFLFPSAVSS